MPDDRPAARPRSRARPAAVLRFVRCSARKFAFAAFWTRGHPDIPHRMNPREEITMTTKGGRRHLDHLTQMEEHP